MKVFWTFFGLHLLLLLGSVILVVVVRVQLVPQFEDIYQQLNLTLPATTQIFFWCHPVLILLIAAAVGYGDYRLLKSKWQPDNQKPFVVWAGIIAVVLFIIGMLVPGLLAFMLYLPLQDSYAFL